MTELLVAASLAGLLAAVALPSLRAPLLRARHSDAVAALMRVEIAEDRLRNQSGLFSGDLAALHLAALSDERLYTLSVELTGPDSYRASASVVAGTPQAADHECAQLTLEFSDGFTKIGPNPRCWGR